MNYYKLAESIGYTHNINGKIVGVYGRVLADRFTGDYLGFSVNKGNGKHANIYVHRFILWLTIHDERIFNTKEWDVHHKNEILLDNRPENLELRNKHAHRSYHDALNARSAKIDYETALKIRVRYNQGGISQKTLAEEHGLSQPHISDIITGKKWGDKWSKDGTG